MKFRNLLRGIPLLVLMALGLSIVLSCKNGPGSNSVSTAQYTVTFDTQGGSSVPSRKVNHGKTVQKPAPNPVRTSYTFDGWYKERAYTTPWNFTKDVVTANITLFAKWIPAVTPTTVSVTFAVEGGHGTLTAKAGDAEWMASDASVKQDIKKGTEVVFTANPAADYEVDSWRINREVKSGTQKTEKVRADKDVTVTVTFKKKGTSATKFFTVDYAAAPADGGSISAKYADGSAISSGDKIQENAVLIFTAEPKTGYDISGWSGDATAEPDNKTAKLTVTKNSSVTVNFALKKYEKHTVTFDTQGGSAVTPVGVEHGKKITKPAPDPANPPFAFGGWYKEKECKTLWNFATDTVTEDRTLYAHWKITIQYDSKKIKCRKNGGGDINPNDSVYIADKLNFEAILPDGKIVDKWSINGTPKDGGTRESFFYTVTASDVKDGSITIDYEDKLAPSATIKFDSNKMTCKKKNGTPVIPDERVYEDIWLTFSAKLPEGEIVKKWLVNSKDKGNATHFQYTVKLADAESGIIRVDYEKRDVAKATIKFDSTKMTCTKNVGQATQATVTTGTTVYEKDLLFFTAKPTSGKTIVKWTVNREDKKKKGDGDLQYFSYTVKATDKDTTITVDYEEQ